MEPRTFALQVYKVQHYRLALADAKAEIKRREDAFRAENADLYASLAETQAQAELEERTLRNATLQHFQETGDKHPHPALGVRETKKLVYDDKLAFAWAKEHDMALALDRKSFEQIAKASPPDFVTETVDIVPTIATDLSKYVEQ